MIGCATRNIMDRYFIKSTYSPKNTIRMSKNMANPISSRASARKTDRMNVFLGCIQANISRPQHVGESFPLRSVRRILAATFIAICVDTLATDIELAPPAVEPAYFDMSLI